MAAQRYLQAQPPGQQLTMRALIEKARQFALQAHRSIGQRRKYTHLPYEVHLEAVAEMVASVSSDPEMIAAAWLHDAVEDTPVTLPKIREKFGAAVAHLVKELTDVSRPGDGNRAMRKALDRQHLAGASARAQTIKLADLIDNYRDICSHDPAFAKVYGKETAALLAVLKAGDERLRRLAEEVLAQSPCRSGV